MDRMDDIWKDRFNSEQLPLGDWNTPDDVVWQSIANATVREKGKHRAAWWLWAIVGLFVILLGVILLTSSKFISDSNTSGQEESTGYLIESSMIPSGKNNTAKQLAQNVSNESRATVKETTNIRQQLNTNKIKTPASILGEAAYSIKEFQKAKNALKVQANESIIKRADNLTKVFPIATPKDTESDNQALIENSTKTKVTNPHIMFDYATTDLITTNAIIETINLNLGDPSPKLLNGSDVNKPTKIAITAALGTSYWQHKISNNYTSDLSAFDFNYTDEFGYLLELDASVPLGDKFDFDFGFEYEQINISSGHNSTITYNPADESTDQSNAYAVSLATPYGLSGADFRFDRSEEIGDDPVDLLVDFHSAHTIKNMAIPLSVQYFPLGKKRKFTPVLRAGMAVNYLSNISNKIQTIDTHHDAIQYDDSGSSNFMAPNITKWHYDYRLGLGARVQWRRDFAITLNYERVGGLNAIFQQDDYSTRINRHHLSIGLQKVLLK